MSRLVAVCREHAEEDYKFLARQIPLTIDDTLTLVMEFSNRVTELNCQEMSTLHWKQFVQYHQRLKYKDLGRPLMATPCEVNGPLAQLVACVGCRKSVERLYAHLLDSGSTALDPLLVKESGMLTIQDECLSDPQKLYSLLYINGFKLNDILNSIPKGRKNKRCQIHSLEIHKPRPLGGSWMDVWEQMSPECREDMVMVDSVSLLETLESYLRKHRFCLDCKTRVLKAFDLLIGEVDTTVEDEYCASVYEGLCCCQNERHIHVCCETEFIAHLLGRAEPEFSGSYEERHAKTIDAAQEEVVTCLGIYLYERLHKIWQKMRAEEQTWQLLFHFGIDALRKNFELSVEELQGISRLEQFVEEMSEEERAKELKQQKKRQKRKDRRKNKTNIETPNPEPKQEEKAPEEESPKERVSREEKVANCEINTAKRVLTRNSNGSDCGYSSSIEGSDPGSREGSLVACSEGICNHNGAEAKEEDGTDSCVDCWQNSEVKAKSKKKRRKAKALANDLAQKSAGHVSKENTPIRTEKPANPYQTKRFPSALCGGKHPNKTLEQPRNTYQKTFTTANQKTFTTANQKTFTTAHQKNITSPQKTFTTAHQKNITSPHQKNITSPHQKNITSPHQKNITSPHQKNITSPHKKNITSPQKTFTTTNPKTSHSTNQKTFITTQQRNITSPQKKNVTSPQKKNVTSPQKKNVTSPQKKNVTSPQKKNVTSPQKKNVTSPQKKNVTSPQKKNVTSPQKKNVTSPQKKNVTSPQKKNVTSPQKKNVTSPQKKNVTSPQKKNVTSPQKTFTTTNPKTSPSTHQKTLTEKKTERSLSLMDMLGNSDEISDEESCLTQDEIQSFLERNKSFYNNRHQYRQLLKDKFTNYCQKEPDCGEETTIKSVK